MAQISDLSLIIREVILDSVAVTDLEFRRQDQYGERYQTVSLIQEMADTAWWVRTGWMVRLRETVARFVTAVPERSKGE
ncbi:DUF6883 domain-containing protein [Leptolyngbya sp. PCC 6406]|uniref:DUF6883 domain-containing protein n=1 Tax=Leptolyngbya sp. PCC 6406 TaxID=1173264 RepID=UPI0002AC0BB1|nr:DUF6883 domain-containing protein [Leptolyngbya sp. PCC 6406]